MAIAIPEPPLTLIQYEQIKTDIALSMAMYQGATDDTQQLWSVVNALYYLIQNPIPPAPEE